MRTAKRALRTSLLLMLPVAVVGTSLYVAHRRQAMAANDLSTTCYGSLSGTTYPTGVAAASLASTNAVAIQPGVGLQLNTALSPFNAQQITLPFDQQVDVKYVYRNAGASHSFGWFYLDQIAQFLNADGSLKDADGDHLYDWFEPTNGGTRPNTGLWQMTTAGIPDIANSTYNYADGGTMPHVPNILESLTGPGKGQWLFKLCDDDGDLSTYGVGSTVGSYPISDVSTTSDGIPDYDVNGDGTVGNELDRTVNMGVVQGNRELVFFAITYYDSTLPKSGLGMGTSGSQAVKVMPFFTKNILNGDRNTLTPGQLLDRCAIKCKPLESGGDPTCYSQYSPAATNGWMTPDAQARLNTPTYGNIDISNDPSVYNITVAADGTAPHFVVLPPASNPNLWLIGYEDLPNNVGDNDFNDVVFMVERSNGGQAISNVISTDIPPSAQSTTQISTLNIQYNISFPAPGCTDVTGAAVNLYWSVDNGVTWNAVPMASATSGNVTIDVLGTGQIGSQLKWRADFVSPVQACQPTLTGLNVGYAAVQHGLFKYAAPIALANMVYAGALETPPFPLTENAATNADYSLRGHFDGNQLYNAATGTQYTPPPLQWDSGLVTSAASSSPDARNIYTSTTNGTTVTTVPFTIANGAVLYPLVLPAAARTAINSATFVYDYNGDAVVDNNDAQYLVQWTRGWEFPSGITFTPAPTTQPLMRAWRLGSLHNSSPAVVGPPLRPLWIDGSAAPPTLAAANNTFRLTPANEARATRAIVGAQDGMLHAFAAGEYRPVGDADTTATCPNTLYRGCFGGTTTGNPPVAGPADYGTGSEVWAWVPPSQLSQLKNDTPSTQGYLPGSNPKGEVDGSVAVDDVFDATLNAGVGGFRTIAYASLGTNQRYITAVDATDPNTPKAVWLTDWTDSAFNGSDLSPSIGLSQIGATASIYSHVLVVSSGLSALAGDLYLYVIDALKGTTTSKVQLNVGSFATQSTGFASYANMVDANQDGLVDRAYAVDTSGRVFKVDLTNNKTCVIASLGETVYSGMAVALESGSSGTAPKVQLFVGGGSNPDGTGTIASSYDFFSYEDDDPVGTCQNMKATLVYKYNLGQTNGVANKVWAAPTVITDATGSGQVFVSSASASSASVCSTGSGAISILPTVGDGSGSVTATQTIGNLTGAPISSTSVYDGHVLVNTTGGTTTVIGGSAWNNKPTNSNVTGVTTQVGLINSMSTLMWQEL